jgi:ribonuclease HI
MILPFGKYKGQTLIEVFNQDRRYIEWLVTTIWCKERHQDIYNESNKCIKNFKDNLVLTEDIILYTDGSCVNNGQPGAISGIGIHFSEFNKYKLNDISKKLTLNGEIATNNHAELSAIDEAIKILIKNKLVDKNIKIYTDSKYSMNCVLKWYEKWVIKNKIENRKNIELIESIYNNIQGKNIELLYIKAHSNNNDDHSIGNKIADELSRKSYL